MRSIERVDISQVFEGQYVTAIDDDSLVTDEAVNEDYAHDEQDWQRVAHTRHQADISHVTLAMYNGDLYTVQGSGFIWRLTEDGQPVEDGQFD